MVTQNPPGVPTFYPGLDTVTQFNTGLFTPTGFSGGVRDTVDFLVNRPKFRARRVASQSTTKNTHQFIVWDTIDVDNYGGGAASSSIYTVQVAGWYLGVGKVTLSQSTAGAAGTALIPALAVNGSSPTGVGSNGWEGQELGIPTGSTDPKCSNGIWTFFANVGDQIQLDLWYSNEPAASLNTGTTAGFQPSISLVWTSK